MQSTPEPRKILLVEDEDDVRFILNWMLSGAGFDVSEACNGADGLDQLQHGRFDLVVTDVGMPVKDGLEMIEDAISVAPETKFVVCTGSDHTDARMIHRLSQKSILKVLHKPLPTSTFVAAVEAAMHQSRYCYDMPPVCDSDEISWA